MIYGIFGSFIEEVINSCYNSQNKIGNESSNLFNNLKRLKILRLEQLNIFTNKIPDELFKNMNSLQKLFLDDNNIKSLSIYPKIIISFIIITIININY